MASIPTIDTVVNAAPRWFSWSARRSPSRRPPRPTPPPAPAPPPVAPLPLPPPARSDGAGARHAVGTRRAFGVLAQTGAPGAPDKLGAPNVPGLDATTVLGQNVAPAAPGVDPGVRRISTCSTTPTAFSRMSSPRHPGRARSSTSHPARRTRTSAGVSGSAATSTCTAPECSRAGCSVKCPRINSVSRCPAPRRHPAPMFLLAWRSSSRAAAGGTGRINRQSRCSANVQNCVPGGPLKQPTSYTESMVPARVTVVPS